MASSALAIAYQQPRGSKDPWGGDMRHRQDDLEGGTDLNDAKAAWASYGETLTIKSGAGWSAVVDAHEDGRAIVIQGTGNVPGVETFDGGHACCIGPETQSDGDWLWGDPLATGWQWVTPGSIRSWAERWQSSIAFAVGEKPPDDPDPEPAPPPDSTPYSKADLDRARQDGDAAGYQRGLVDGEVRTGDAAVGAWLDWLRAPAPGPADVWDGGSWSELATLLGATRQDADPCDPTAPARWARGGVLAPASDAYHAMTTPAVWGAPSWRELAWT